MSNNKTVILSGLSLGAVFLAWSLTPQNNSLGHEHLTGHNSHSAVHAGEVLNSFIEELKNDKKFMSQKPDFSLLVRTKKLQPAIEVKWALSSPAPQVAGDIFEVTAQITTQKTIQRMQWKLLLPRGVALVSGRTEGFVDLLEARSEQTLSFRLKQQSDQNEKIQLILIEPSTNHLLGSGVFYSLEHERFEKELQELAQRQQEYIEQTEGFGSSRQTRALASE